MKVLRHPDASAFLAAAGPFLAEREALHNLPLAIAARCASDPSVHPGPNYFAEVADGRGIAGIAMMTAPYRLQFYAPPAAAEAVAADLADGGFPVPGVHGPDPSARAFAAAWCGPRGLRPSGERRMRAFALSAVTDPPAPPGRMRRAGPGDGAVVASFYRGFFEETGSAHGGASPEDLGLRAIREGRLRLWEDDGGPVCQAVDGGSTPRGRRVGAVYSPPGLRRRGYATALVAALSRELLEGGASFCFLFTDLANPVSNSIYPKIGYRPVADFAEIDFAPPGTGAEPR